MVEAKITKWGCTTDLCFVDHNTLCLVNLEGNLIHQSLAKAAHLLCSAKHLP